MSIVGVAPATVGVAEESAEVVQVQCDDHCGAAVTLRQDRAIRPPWKTVRDGDGPDAPTWHFSSLTCLINWAHEQEPDQVQDYTEADHAAALAAQPVSEAPAPAEAVTDPVTVPVVAPEEASHATDGE